MPLISARPADAHPATEWRFHSVSLLKLAALSMATFGLYNIYWFYQHWRREQRFGSGGVTPWARALFAPLMSYSLFTRVRDARAVGGLPEGLSAGALTVAYFLWTNLYRLPDPYWLVSLFAFVPLLPVQAAVNELNVRLAPEAPPNDQFKGRDIAVLIIGGFVVLLAVVGSFLPAEGP